MGEIDRGMMMRKLMIVKLTPIALGFCDACKKEFNSRHAVEDDAEVEMREAFESHNCTLHQRDLESGIF